jgi:2',3'-cyclic-nucleotide 2'-phosphodiesterase (5'-nucleotidase family)
MLIANMDKVRAVFTGHTHNQYRLKVLDPAGAAANDLSLYPDEEGGIYQVDVGTAGGRGNETVTFVQVQVDGKKVSFRTIENSKDNPFHLKDEWSTIGK